MGLDAAGKTTILYKLKLGEIVTTIPTIGKYFLHHLLPLHHPNIVTSLPVYRHLFNVFDSADILF